MQSRMQVAVAMGTLLVGSVILMLAAGDPGPPAPSTAAIVPVAAETAPADGGLQAEAVEPPSTSVPATVATTTTTSIAESSTTTTTSPVTTTVATTPVTAWATYTSVPKPGGGQDTVAPGGALTKHLAADLASAFGFSAEEVESAIDAVNLPIEAGGNPEGWLAPGTYEVPEGAGALDVVQAMVDRRIAQLEARAIPREQWYRVLTAASVIEKETYNQNEKPRVARVLTNRLAGGGPLQMDSIILYPVPEDRIFTTSEERASDQPYNSYRHNGLPPTPICAPDDASIDAFLAPPPGNWWFYVTIDLHTGETRYAVTYEEHKANVELLRAWLRENPTN